MTSMNEFRRRLMKHGIYVCDETFSRYVDLLLTVVSDDDLLELAQSPSLKHKVQKELRRRLSKRPLEKRE